MKPVTRTSITTCRSPRLSNTTMNTSSMEEKNVSVDRILNADKSGFLPKECDLSSDATCDFSVSFEKSLLEAQIKRVVSSNEAMESTVKRIRTEANHSVEDLRRKNEALEVTLSQYRLKISDLELVISQRGKFECVSNQSLDRNIQALENEKAQLEFKYDQLQVDNSKQTLEAHKTIASLKHQLVDYENQIKLLNLECDQLKSFDQDKTKQLDCVTKQVDLLQTRVTELETLLAKSSKCNVVDESILHDVNRLSDVRYENQQLKQEIELLKLKCSDRIRNDEEIRSLRKQVQISEEYRLLIAKQQEEISKLHEQLKAQNSSTSET